MSKTTFCWASQAQRQPTYINKKLTDTKLMIEKYLHHNHFKQGLKEFLAQDPHLFNLAQLHYQHSDNWWQSLPLDIPGIYILTGGRQVGKSTSCKLLIKHCLQNKRFAADQMLYLPCDEIFDAAQLSKELRWYLDSITPQKFLLIIDEITFVKHWDRVIKALADEGYFSNGICLLTGSDSLILKEAAMRFPGRRGRASQTDFHLYPLTFREYVQLVNEKYDYDLQELATLFQDFLKCGGYLRAINDIADHGKILPATYAIYEQWVRGDFLKNGKKETTLSALLQALMTVGVSQISYSSLTQKIGSISKDTCIDYCNLLERMDILLTLQAYDQNKKQGFPRKDRKFHFIDPFIYHTLHAWLTEQGFLNSTQVESTLIEATVASHCKRFARTFYFKGQGEIDVIMLKNNKVHAIEVKWSKQMRANDLNMLKHFTNGIILRKEPLVGKIENIKSMPVYQFLYELE